MPSGTVCTPTPPRSFFGHDLPLVVALAISLAALAASPALGAPQPPPGYQRPWSHAVSLGDGAVLRPPQLLWSETGSGGSLQVFWAAETEAGLAVVARTLTFREGRMEVGPATILRQGGDRSPGAGAPAGAPVRPHQPLPLPGGRAGGVAGLPESRPLRLVWVEGSPGNRSLWIGELKEAGLEAPVMLASGEADARAPAAVTAADGSGTTLAWLEGSGGTGRLVVSRAGPGGAFGLPVTLAEGMPMLAFGMARSGPQDHGLVLERTGETTARLWSFRVRWPAGPGEPQVSLESVAPQVGLPDRTGVEFTWTASPAGDLDVLAILTLRDRSVLPAAYLFHMDPEGELEPAQALPLQPGAQPQLTGSRGLDLVWIAPDTTETWQVLSSRLDPSRPHHLNPMPVTAGWRGGFAPAALRDPQGNLHVVWASARAGHGWELLYRTDRVPETTLLAERLQSVASPRRPERFLAFLGFFAFIAVAGFLPAQGPALVLVWAWERLLGSRLSRRLWLAGVLGADLASRVGLLPFWSPETFNLGAWALTFRPAYLVPPLLLALWVRWRPNLPTTHRGRWQLALSYLAAQAAITAWPFTLWKLAGLG